MNTKRLLLAGAAALLAAYGCGASDADDSAGTADTSEDQLILGHGSVDHAAIVEATTMQLTTGITDFAPVLDPYNQADPFAIAPGNFRATFLKNLAKFDGEDGKTDWPADQAAAWADRMATSNYQVVDLSKPCNFDDPHTYLEIERAQMAGREHTTCGGRNPNEDAMDVTLNWLIRGPAASALDQDAISDGVSQATVKASSTFPYLGEMNGI